MDLRVLVPVIGLITLVILGDIAAAQSITATSLPSHPGCYARCRYIELDYDPGQTEELCDKERALGSLFLDNIKACADCVRDEGGLNDFFDTVDAQDALKIVNLCQSLYTSDHSEMISAMSVIMETGSVLGNISPTKSPTSTSVPTATQTSESQATTDAGSSEPTASTEDLSSSGSRAWVAGPVVGSVAGVSVIIGAAFLIVRRRNRRKTAQDTTEQGSGPDKLHDKPELPAEERIRHELDGQYPVETEARTAPQELNAGEVAELPADNGK